MANDKLCCATCFGDQGLRKQVIPTFSRSYGTCSYCNTKNINLVLPADLRDHFELLISIYVEDKTGEPLVHWLKVDWGMLAHPSMDQANSCMLLADILDNGDIVRKNFIPSKLCTSDSLDLWGSFREELMYQNRFFPENKIDEDLFSKLLQHLVTTPNGVSEEWYRARVQRGSAFTIDDMGAPPKEKASQGRANPAGIPYLYLASTENTAASEVRPHTGETVSVATFAVPNNLEVIDLRDPRITVSPFILSDEKEIASLRGDIDFLVHLGKELTRPVVPHVKAIDYIPTQFLCEFIKKNAYHGVLYHSSVSDGVNLALFNPNQAMRGRVHEIKVSRVSVELEG